MVTTLTRTTTGRLILLGFLLTVPMSGVLGQQPRGTTAIQVVPQPRQVNVTSEKFRLSRETRIVLADPRSDEDRFAAQDFVDDVKETAGLALPVGKTRSSRS